MYTAHGEKCENLCEGKTTCCARSLARSRRPTLLERDSFPAHAADMRDLAERGTRSDVWLTRPASPWPCAASTSPRTPPTGASLFPSTFLSSCDCSQAKRSPARLQSPKLWSYNSSRWPARAPEIRDLMSVDVAIVGGGPGGLALAQALRRVKVPKTSRPPTVRVLEKLPGLERVGAGVALHPEAMRALDAIQPAIAQRIRDTAYRSPMSGPLLLHPWHRVRSYLAEGLEDVVTFGAEVADISAGEGEEPFRIVTGAGEEIRAKAVVGADGYFSSVRRTLMPESRVPEFQDVIMYRAMVPPELGAEGGALRSRALRPPTTINDMVCLLYPVSDSETCWTISIKHSTMEKRGLRAPPALRAAGDPAWRDADESHEGVLARVLALVSGQGLEDLEEAIEATERGKILEHGLFSVHQAAAEGQLRFVKGRVALLGDAAHSSRPTGIGLTLAFEDAWQLAQSVAAHGVTEEAMADYEAKRMPRIRSAVIAAQLQGELAYGFKRSITMDGEEWDHVRASTWSEEEKEKFQQRIPVPETVNSVAGKN